MAITYPYTLLSLRQEVLSMLGQNAITIAGDLPSGDGTAATYSTTETLNDFINQISEDICRTCYPLNDEGTVSVATGTATVPLSTVVCTSGNTLWAARGVAWNDAMLEHTSREAAEIWYDDWLTGTLSTPLHWSGQGSGAVNLYPRPSNTGTLTASGFAVPVRLAADDDVATWLQPDLAIMLIEGACWKTAVKNMQNPDLASRAQVWQSYYEVKKAAQFLRVQTENPMLARMLVGAQPG